jgi:hypothetical protein
MVLNALAVPAPAAVGSYRLFTQGNVLDALTEPVTSDRTVARRGMALIEVAHVLRAYGLFGVGARRAWGTFRRSARTTSTATGS